MPRMQLVVVLLCLATTLQGHMAAADCSDAAATLQTGPCAQLQAVVQPIAAKYAAASCSTITALIPTLHPDPSDVCCSDIRNFIAMGCACDDAARQLTALAGIADSDSQATLTGGALLAQASRCSTAALGGPIFDPCTGSVGCPMVADSPAA